MLLSSCRCCSIAVIVLSFQCCSSTIVLSSPSCNRDNFLVVICEIHMVERPKFMLSKSFSGENVSSLVVCSILPIIGHWARTAFFTNTNESFNQFPECAVSAYFFHTLIWGYENVCVYMKILNLFSFSGEWMANRIYGLHWVMNVSTWKTQLTSQPYQKNTVLSSPT